MSPENSPVVCDGYVNYEEAQGDRLPIMQDYKNKKKNQLKMAARRPF